MRNVAIRNNSSPLPTVSAGVSRHEAQYSRVEVSRVTVSQLQWIPGSGAEVQKTLAIRKLVNLYSPVLKIFLLKSQCPSPKQPIVHHSGLDPPIHLKNKSL